MHIAFKNIKKPETQFRERVKIKMIEQIRKKFLGTGGRIKIKPNCDAPFKVHNNIQK